MSTILSYDSLDTIDCDAVITTFFSDERPLKQATGLIDWRMNSHLSQLIIKNKISGALGELILIPTHGRLQAKNIVLCGLGKSMLIDETSAFQLVESLNKSLLTMNFSKILFPLSRFLYHPMWTRSVFSHFLSHLKFDQATAIFNEMRSQDEAFFQPKHYYTIPNPSPTPIHDLIS